MVWTWWQRKVCLRALSKTAGDLKTVCAAVALVWSAGAFAQDDKTVLSEKTYVAPEKGGPRRWQVSASSPVELRKSPEVSASALETLQDGAVLSNLGCTRSGESIWCQVQPLRSRVRGHVPAQHLRPARGPAGNVPMGANDSIARAGASDFDATGNTPCAQTRTGPLEECSFGVARSDGGDATVVATFSNSFQRTLFFEHGIFISGNPTMSGTGRDTDWNVTDGRHLIRVDDQRYELTETDIFGR